MTDASKPDRTEGVKETGEGVESAGEVWGRLLTDISPWFDWDSTERVVRPRSILEGWKAFFRDRPDAVARCWDSIDRGESPMDERWVPVARGTFEYQPGTTSWSELVYAVRGLLDGMEYNPERHLRVSVNVEQMVTEEGTSWDRGEAESERGLGESREQGLGDTSVAEFSGDWERDSFGDLRLLRGRSDEVGL